MIERVRISARISTVTNERLERFVRSTGTTRSQLIEQALLHHLSVLDELPTDAVVPARVVLDRESAELVRAILQCPPGATDALRQLFDDG